MAIANKLLNGTAEVVGDAKHHHTEQVNATVV